MLSERIGTDGVGIWDMKGAFFVSGQLWEERLASLYIIYIHLLQPLATWNFCNSKIRLPAL